MILTKEIFLLQIINTILQEIIYYCLSRISKISLAFFIARNLKMFGTAIIMKLEK